VADIAVLEELLAAGGGEEDQGSGGVGAGGDGLQELGDRGVDGGDLGAVGASQGLELGLGAEFGAGGAGGDALAELCEAEGGVGDGFAGGVRFVGIGEVDVEEAGVGAGVL
jgi:hypothetical protein